MGAGNYPTLISKSGIIIDNTLKDRFSLLSVGAFLSVCDTSCNYPCNF
jgi:hypothetical protein